MAEAGESNPRDQLRDLCDELFMSKLREYVDGEGEDDIEDTSIVSEALRDLDSVVKNMEDQIKRTEHQRLQRALIDKRQVEAMMRARCSDEGQLTLLDMAKEIAKLGGAILLSGKEKEEKRQEAQGPRVKSQEEIDMEEDMEALKKRLMS